MAGGGGEWTPFIAMLAVDFAFAIVNIMLKKVVNEGMNHLVIITYRLAISTVFLAPIAWFSERYYISIGQVTLLFDKVKGSPEYVSSLLLY